MSFENNKMQVDIENLFKQNINDLSALKELYRKLKEVEEKFLQIKYIDSTLANKLKKEYEKLKKIILDENAQAQLSNDIETINVKLSDVVETINSELVTNMNELDKKVNEKIGRTEVEYNYAKKSEIGKPSQEQVDNWLNSNPQATTTVQDKSVENIKLVDNFDYAGAVTTGSLNDVVRAGVYRIGNAVTDNPLGLKSSVLIQKNIGGLFYQKIYDQTNSQQQFERIYSSSSINDISKWKDISKNLSDNSVNTSNLCDYSVTNIKLADDYIYRGLITSGSVNDCLKDGIYYIGINVSDNPLGAKPSFLINKNVDSRIYQVIFSHSDSINKYERIILKTAEELNDKSKWLKLNIPEETPLPLKGKKIVHFGDSILQYGNYPNKISEITGAITYNCGIGGGTLASHPISDYEPLSLVNLVDNIVAGDFTTAIEGAENLYAALKDDKREVISLLSTIDFNDIDIITIAYGTNDFGNKVKLGEPNSEEKTTFNGALNYVIKTLMTKYPNIKIYLFTPIYRTKLGTSNFEDGLTYVITSTGLKLLDYVDSVIARGQERGCPVYDAFRNMGINYFNSETYLKDGLHPNEYGDSRLADNYSKFLISN